MSSIGEAATNVVASCYIQYIALDIVAMPPLQVFFAFSLASMTRSAVVLVFWTGMTQPLDQSRSLLLLTGLAKAATLYLAIISTKGLLVSNSRDAIWPYVSSALMAYALCAHVFGELRAAAGIKTTPSYIGLIAGTVAPPLIASVGAEPWEYLQRGAIAAAFVTVVSACEAALHRQPAVGQPQFRALFGLLRPLRRRPIDRMLVSVCFSQLAAAILVTSTWLSFKYCFHAPLWGSASAWSATNALVATGVTIGAMHSARVACEGWWARIAARYGAVSSWRLSSLIAAALLLCTNQVTADTHGSRVAVVVLLVLTGAAAGGTWCGPSGLASAAMASSVPPATSSEQQQRRVNAVQRLVTLSQIAAWGMQSGIVGALLHHIEFVPSVEASAAQQAAIQWLVFGTPAVLLVASAACAPAEKRKEKRSRRLEQKAEGVATPRQKLE